MISKLAARITEVMCNKKLINKEDYELYQYGYYLVLSKALFFILTVLIGTCFGILKESVLFYVVFSAIREYAGGYHASKELVCSICTVILILIGIFFIWYLEHTSYQIVSLMVLGLSSGVIYIVCPLDSENKPLTDKEYTYYRYISRMIVYGVLILAVLSEIWGKFNIVSALAASMLIESTLLLFGVWKKKVLHFDGISLQ